MACTINEQLINDTISFHGHNCPGLSIGIRASELALRKLNRTKGDKFLTVVETDMCAVDAIQYLTGCTFGKGNLIHKDFGKIAFTFYDQEKPVAFRITLKEGCFGPERKEMRSLMKKSLSQELTPEEQERLKTLRQNQISLIMNHNLDDLFVMKEIENSPPRPAKIMESHKCATCGDMTMESRVRLFDGQNLCIPCFEQVEQKK
ncbi:FmdE family protein [Desulfonatronovibrio magnus]|uniref:FmdE family protein n=1 Tax=Desulfonatronovibrio magnus TaxID=698827 RepID=UPI0005EB1C8E|nr:FmdE family protein [Desulfonatronovibrio magnus]